MKEETLQQRNNQRVDSGLDVLVRLEKTLQRLWQEKGKKKEYVEFANLEIEKFIMEKVEEIRNIQEQKEGTSKTRYEKKVKLALECLHFCHELGGKECCTRCKDIKKD